MILKQYHKEITHMRQRNKDRKFILCFGAGVCKHWNLPNWSDLVDLIAKNERVNGEEVIKLCGTSTTKAQLLFEHFKYNYRINKASVDVDDKTGSTFSEFDFSTREWIEIIHEELYKRINKANKHPYIDEYLNIIKRSPVTINYNFDDLVEQLLFRTKDKGAIDKGFETVWTPSTQFKKDAGVIYHPNGFLPEKLTNGYSEHFVFTESAYQDQLLASMFGHYNTLFYLFARYTTLFIGSSLDDQNLRHLLHQNARINPGHYHYYVYYTESQMSEQEKFAMRKAYFDMYNLIVLFLNDDGIKELAEWINADDYTFSEESHKLNLDTKYLYYISGSAGVGKTTALNYFQSFYTYNEWPDIKDENLDKRETDLQDDEREQLDRWISNQFRKKNTLISKNEEGIILIDRSPLDPLTYALEGKCADRAIELNKTYYQTCYDSTLAKGRILILKADPNITLNRLKKRASDNFDNEWIRQKECKFDRLFGTRDVRFLDTSSLTKEEMVKAIGYIIFNEPYNVIDINKYLDDYCKGYRTLDGHCK